MANWATTGYVIEGPVDTLVKIEQAIKHPVVKEGSDENWEGNVLNTLGITWEPSKPDGTGYCMRGFIDTEPSWEKDTLRFDAEEAWNLTDFYKCLEKAFPEIKVYWIVEEEMMGIFETNDKEGKYFKARYMLDCCIGEEYYSEYFSTEEQLFDYLSAITNGKITNNEDIENFNESLADDAEDYIKVFEFKISD